MTRCANSLRLSSVAAVILVGAFATRSDAANGTWNSTAAESNEFWTNSLNWSASPYPAGNQTATFNNAGNGRTTIDLIDLSFGCSNIVFDTSSVAAYTLGSGGINSQALVFTNNSMLRLSSSVANSQTLNAIAALGHNNAASSHNFRNDKASVALNFAGDVTSLNGGGTAGTKTLITLGSGPFTISGNLSRGTGSALNFTNNTFGLTTLTGSNRVNSVYSINGPLLFSGTNHISLLEVNIDRPVTFSGTNLLERITFNGTAYLPATVNIAADSYLALTNSGGPMLYANQDAFVNGPGTLSLLHCTPGNPTGDNYAAPGKTLTINAPMNGPNALELWSGTGTYVLNGINIFDGNVTLGPAGTLSVAKIGNKGSTTSNLGRGSVLVLNASGCRLLYTGVGESADRTLDINGSAIIEQAGSGHLNLTAPILGANTSRTLTLQGSTTATAEFSGLLSNDGGGTLSLAKSGSGLWLLTTNHTYSGATTVNAGILALSGANGTIASSTGYTLNGGTLLLDNTAAANHANRLRDASAITLNGGTLRFSNDGGADSFAENAGTLAVNAGNSTVATVQAAVGQTATLRFASLTRTAGAVNFTGTGLGQSDRNRIFITGQADGLIGPWATVNGAYPAAYSSVMGVYAAADEAFADIAARGPSTIVSNDASSVRINSAGVFGPIELSAEVTRVASIVQNTATPAEINTAGKTLQTGGIVVPANRASVTVGLAPADGTLTALQPNGTLDLSNDDAGNLTVNAVIADNGATPKLNKLGSGTVTLAAANTFSGALTIGGGSLVLANSDALQNVTVSSAGTVFDSSVASHAFTLGSLNGTLYIPLQDNGGNPVALSVGNNNASATLSGNLSGPGSLAKVGNGVLTLNSANSFAGGMAIRQGTVIVTNNANALGVGPVVNDATLNLNAGNVTYSGLSTTLTGAGTNNVTLSTGSNTTTLNGDYTGFAGLWNLGMNGSGGKAQMNGPDNAAATINILSNATLYCAIANQHNATINLYGGNTGETYGQLRLDANAVWAGPITLRGPLTDIADAYFGANGGQTGYYAGVIDDLGAGYTNCVVGGGASVFANPTNTYLGPTWVKAGTLRVAAMGSVNGGASPLGSPTSAEQGTVLLGRGGTGATLNYFGMGESTDRLIDLAGTTGTGVLYFGGTNTWTLTSDVISSGVGAKQLKLDGVTNNVGVLAGVVNDTASGHAVNVYKAGFNTWTLTRDNLFSGKVEVNQGILVVTHSGALGISNKFVQVNNGSAGNPQLHLDGTGGDITFATNLTFLTSNQTDGALRNLAGNNRIEGLIRLQGGGGDTVVHAVAGKLTLAGSIVGDYASGPRTLRLRGDGDGEVSGPITNGNTTVGVVRESGSGTWTLSASNTYTLATTVSADKLVVGGADGFITGPVTINPTGTFVVANNPLSNSVNRLSDASTLTLNGGTFRYEHTGGAADYRETAGPLTVSANSNIVFTTRADVGQTSAITFASLARTGGGALDFQGEGLGLDARNAVFIAAQTNGLIGLWTTYNSTNFAAYDLALGVVAADDSVFTDIPAKGPYEITNDPLLAARITIEGTNGPTALAGVPASALKALLQDSAFASTVGMTNQTLQVSDVMIAAGKEALTLGTEAEEGLVMPDVAGGSLSLINRSSNVLTLNAGITNNGTASGVGKYGPGAVKLAGQATYTGATVIDEGDLEYASQLQQSLPGAISGAGSLTKSGTNLLHILGANTYAGPTLISAGTVRPDKDNAFGTPDGGVTIASGATLDLGCDSSVGGTRGANTLRFGNKVFTVSGSGVGEAGAIVNNSSQDQQYAINYLKLAGDTTVGGTRRWDLRANYPVFDMYDHTLSKTGANEFCIINTTVNPGAGHLVINQNLLRLETGTVMNGSPANTITANTGTTLDLWNFAPLSGGAPTWSLIFKDRSTFREGSGNNTNQNEWAGPISLDGTVFFNGGGTTRKTLYGEISGLGNLVKNGNNASVLYLLGTNNSYSGGTQITNGTLFAQAPGSLPGYDSAGQVTVFPGATLSLPSGDGATGWNGTQIKALSDNAIFVTNTSILNLDATLENVHVTGDLAQPFTLTKQGNRALTLSGVNSFNGPVNVTRGEVVMNGAGNHRLGNVTVGSASFVVTNDTASHTYATNTVVGNGAAEFGCMTLAGNAAWGTVLPAQNRASPTMQIGVSGRGVLVLQDSAIVTNMLRVGVNAGSHGAVYQRGNSRFHNWGGQGNDGRVGQSGYGYYELSSGTMTNNGYFQVGVTATGVGILRQTGGDFHQATAYGGTLGICRGGTGVVHLVGGTFRAYQTINVGEFSGDGYMRGFAEFTVDGAADALVAGNLNIGDRTNMFATVNLNGGTLTANQLSKANRPYSLALVNFDGGTLQARTAGNLFGANANTPDKVHVYQVGATFDTANLAVTANANLSAPSGNGVSGITITPRGGYIGPPMVTITGGGGYGATAVANFDSASGAVTGVTITSPGYDYTSLPTVTLAGGGTNLQTLVTGVTLAPNTSGGLTKQGNGTLTLSGTNTYGGATTLSAGTLKPVHNMALPANTTLTFAGGTLDLNGLTLSNLVNTSGSLSGGITNGTLRTILAPAGDYSIGTQTYSLNIRSGGSLQAEYHADVAADGGCDVLAVQGNVNLSSYALKIVDMDGLDRHKQYTILTCTGTRTGTFAYTNITDARWKVLYKTDGTVKLGFYDGSVVILR